MAKQVTINKSFYDKKSRLDEIPAEAIKEKAEEIAQTYVSLSPVDTGAYITSGSILPTGSGGGRSRTSAGKPRFQSHAEKQAEALGQLMSDIAAIDFKKIKKFILRNRSPHANAVEKKHAVFASIRNIFG